jgi:CBS domain containing-hemolysin-like protein
LIERPADQLFLVGGSCLVWNLNCLCGFAIPETEAYATLRGFLLTQLQCRPRVGDAVEHGDWRYTILAGRAALI